MSFQTESTQLTPNQRREVREASQPIESIAKAKEELLSLNRRAEDIAAGLEKARQTYKLNRNAPAAVPEDAKAKIRQAAEEALTQAEIEARRHIEPIRARASAISDQLDEAKAQPSLVKVDAGTLESANRYAPLLEREISGLSAEQILKRLEAARIRDDDAELLAMVLAVRPKLKAASLESRSNAETRLIWQCEDVLRELSRRFRDTSLDAPAFNARSLNERLQDLDREIMDEYSERTGDHDPYGFLIGMR